MDDRERKALIQKAKREYIAGRGSLHALAQKYGLSDGQLERPAAREKWSQLRGKAKEKAEERIVSSAAEGNAKFYGLVEQLVDLTAGSMQAAKDAGGFVSPKSVESYANAVAAIQKIKGIKSDLDTQEQQARIDKLRREVEAARSAAADSIEIDLGGAAEWAR